MSPARRTLLVQTTTLHGRPVVQVQGEIDLRTSPELRDRLLEAAQEVSGQLLIDLSAVDYIDSSGVGTLVYMKREVEKAGGQLVLIGPPPRVRGIFEVTRLDTFFRIVPSVDEVGAA